MLLHYVRLNLNHAIREVTQVNERYIGIMILYDGGLLGCDGEAVE